GLRRGLRLTGLALRLSIQRVSRAVGGAASRPVASILPDVDVLHYAGGGYVLGVDPRTFAHEWIIRALLKLANPSLRVVGSGLGVGPVPKGSAWLVRAFFRGFDAVSFRDAASARLAG